VRKAGIALLFAAWATAAEASSGLPGATPLQCSEALAQSEIARQGSALEFKAGAKGTWSYTTGFFSYALLRLSRESGDPSYGAYAAHVVTSYLAPDGSIRGYDPKEHNLDLVTPGRAVLQLYEQTHEPKLAQAAKALRGQLEGQPRTSEGGFYHKGIYPNQIWLDGLYMSGPFYAHYGALFGDPGALADAAHQILIADQHLYDPVSGLYYHAWDATHTLLWADPLTGHSPNFWARSIGWYAMAIVDELDDLPRGQPSTASVQSVLRRVLDGIVRWQDPASGVWWQVVDQGPRAGNYREASASCMFVYALAKAVNQGLVPPSGPYQAAARKGYAGLLHEFIRREGDGRVSLTHCCVVAGLNNRNAAGRVRDGSFDYYVSEPVVDNDLKGVAPFILAGLEVQRLPEPVPSIPAR
jgi:unsaturated rhamnogalacturonyl hydrolase